LRASCAPFERHSPAVLSSLKRTRAGAPRSGKRCLQNPHQQRDLVQASGGGGIELTGRLSTAWRFRLGVKVRARHRGTSDHSGPKSIDRGVKLRQIVG